MTGDRGQAIVEFALVLPVLLVVTLAVILVTELGVARLALQHATGEGARVGALTNDDAAIRGTVGAAVTPLRPDTVYVEIDPPASRPPRSITPRGTLLTVSATYRLPVPLAFVGLPSLVVRASAVRRIEWSPEP